MERRLGMESTTHHMVQSTVEDGKDKRNGYGKQYTKGVEVTLEVGTMTSKKQQGYGQRQSTNGDTYEGG